MWKIQPQWVLTPRKQSNKQPEFSRKVYSVSHSIPNPAFLYRCSVSQQLGPLQTHTKDTHYRHALNTHYRHTTDAHYRHTLQTRTKHTLQTHTTDAHYRHTLLTHSSSFLTQRTHSCSNFVAKSSLVLELLNKCRVR
jgi:hypothetical protein